MLIKCIHSIIPDRLYAVQWDGCKENCFDELFSWLTDVEAMRTYFSANRQRTTKGFYRIPSIQEAVSRTIEEGTNFAIELLDAAESKYESALNELFEELSPGLHLIRYRRYKAKGDQQAPWIRVYAVKIEGAYIITGGGIKLVKAMQDDPDLEIELSKIKKVDQYLDDEYIDNTDALEEDTEE